MLTGFSVKPALPGHVLLVQIMGQKRVEMERKFLFATHASRLSRLVPG